MIRRIQKAVILAALMSFATTVTAQQASYRLQSDELGSTRNVHAFGKSLLCGQPDPDEFAQAKRRGIEVVITLRETSEINWDEASVVRNLGMEFHSLGFRSPDSLSDELLDKSLQLLADAESRPVMLHCASANRVGAVWLAHRVVNDSVPIAQAREEAREVGLRTPAYEEKVLQYLRTRARD